MCCDFLRRGHRRPDGSAAAPARERTGAFHAPVRLVRRVANWPPGTPVTIVEPFGGAVMVEVPDALGATLDVLVVRRELLTV
jgi:predicted phosphoribosyltransferase